MPFGGGLPQQIQNLGVAQGPSMLQGAPFGPSPFKPQGAAGTPAASPASGSLALPIPAQGTLSNPVFQRAAGMNPYANNFQGNTNLRQPQNQLFGMQPPTY